MNAFRHSLRVRYGETDRMGVAHHASYVGWLEVTRTEWLRARGKSYRQLEDEGSLLQVVELQVAYLRSVTFDDEVEISLREVERGPASITLGYELRRPGAAELLATARTRLACVGKDGRIRRLPREI